MKVKKLLLWCACLYGLLVGQVAWGISVDPGQDRTILLGEATQLGGNPTAQGDNDAIFNITYTYDWVANTGVTVTNTSNPTVTPNETTEYELTVTDSDGFTCTEYVLVKVVDMVLHPLATDFDSDKIGRVMISTTQDNNYYTTNQTQDAQVNITAELTPTNEIQGETIYFRVRDIDDASPYEPDQLGNDNRDPIIQAGKFISTNSATTNKIVPINGVVSATLQITQQYAGDNYVVEASLNANFNSSIKTTIPLVAWKRMYLEMDEMYKKGATLIDSSLNNTASNGLEVSIFPVDNMDDFAMGDEIIVFDKNVSLSVTIHNQPIVVIDTFSSNGIGYVFTERIPTRFPPLKAGIKLADNDDTFSLSFANLHLAYGNNTNGNDGGVYTEIITGNIENIGQYMPKYTHFDGIEIVNLDIITKYWFDNLQNQDNVIQLIAGTTYFPTSSFSAGGVTFEDNNISFIAAKSFENSNKDVTSTIVHEIGHQFGLLDPPITHVDKFEGGLGSGIGTHSHDGQGVCVMSYANIKTAPDTHIEFDTTCIYTARDANDPL